MQVRAKLITFYLSSSYLEIVIILLVSNSIVMSPVYFVGVTDDKDNGWNIDNIFNSLGDYALRTGSFLFLFTREP